MLDQGAVGVEEQLGVEKRAAVTFVDPDGYTIPALRAASPIASLAGDGIVTA